jgi:hypothetical protein
LTTSADQISNFTQQYNSIGDLTLYLPPAGWLLLVVATVWGLWQRKRGILNLGTWWFLFLIATNPSWLCLPGSGVISNFAFFIAIYILWGVLVGALAGTLLGRCKSRVRNILVVLIILTVGGLGARERLGDIHVNQHAMVTRSDMRAMDWIQEHVSDDARFLVNSFFAYGGNAVVGSDAGWWLPVLANRANTVPPLTYGLEQEPTSGYRLRVRETTAQIQEEGIDCPETLMRLKEYGVTHVYIGQQQGRVNYNGLYILDFESLSTSEFYHLAYHQDRVWIFEIR